MTVSAAPFLGRIINGTTPTSTGVQSYTSAGLGDPAGALIIGSKVATAGTPVNGWSQTWGITDGTNSRSCYSSSRDNVATGVSTVAGHNSSIFRLVDPATGSIIVEGVFSAWTTNGISINWTTVDASAWHFSILLLGGSQCQCFVADALPPGSPFSGATTVTPGFATDFVLTHTMRSTNGSAGTQADHGPGIAIKNGGSPLNYAGQFMVDAGATSNARTRTTIGDLGSLMTLNVGSAGDSLVDKTVIQNFTSTTVDVVDGSAGGQSVRIAMLCVKVTGTVTVGVALSDAITPTATGNQAATWPGFKAGLLYPIFSNNTTTTDTGNGNGGVGFSDMRTSGCVQITGKTNVATSKTRAVKTNALMDQYNVDQAQQYTVSIVSQDATGYTLNFTVAPASGRKYYILAVQEMPITVSPTGIASAQAMGSPTIVRGAITVSPTGIASVQAMGNPTIVRGTLTVSPTGIASAQVMGSPTIVRGTLTVSPTAIASAQAMGSPTIVRGTLIASPIGIGSAQAMGSPTIVRGTLTVSPTSIGSAQAMGVPTIIEPITVSPVGIGSAQAMGMPTLFLGVDTIVPVGIPSTQAMGFPTIVLGTLTISPVGIGSAQAMGSPTIVRGTLTVHPTGIGSAEVCGTPVINNGGVLVFPVGITSAQAMGSPTIVRGAITVHPVGIGSAEVFGSPTIVRGAITVGPVGIPSAQMMGSPTIILGTLVVSPSSIGSGEVFGIPTIFVATPQTVLPNGIPSAEAFGNITIILHSPQMQLNKKRAYDAIMARVAAATFLRIGYDQVVPSAIIIGATVSPKSALLNEVTSTFVEAKRWRRTWKQQRDRWIWNLIISFDKEASTELFERDMLDNPIHFPADHANGLEAFKVKAMDANYLIPPQQQSSNGTRASYRIVVEFAPV